jgi:hypothetical protein
MWTSYAYINRNGGRTALDELGEQSGELPGCQLPHAAEAFGRSEMIQNHSVKQHALDGTRPSTASCAWGRHRRVNTREEASGLRFGSPVHCRLIEARVEPLTLLAAVAQATERVAIGTAALIPAFRHPVVSRT